MRRYGGFKFGAKTSVYLLTASGFAAFTYHSFNANDFPPSFLNGIVRSSRALFAVSIYTTPFYAVKGVYHSFSPVIFSILQITSCVVDYKYSLHGLPAGSDEYGRTLSEVWKVPLVLFCVSIFWILMCCFIMWFTKICDCAARYVTVEGKLRYEPICLGPALKKLNMHFLM